MEKKINLQTQFDTLYTKGLDRSFKNLYTIKLLKGTTDITQLAGSPTPTLDLSFLAESVTLGNDEIAVEFNDANLNHFISNASTFKNLSITFRENSDYSVLRFFQWYLQYKIYNFQDNYFIDGDPTITIYIYLSVMDDISDPKIKIERAIPISLQYPDVSWSSPEPQTISVTFSLDRGFITALSTTTTNRGLE